MPLSDHARWRVALRVVGIVVAVAAAALAVWLIVRGDDSKTVQIGVIIGLAAALLGSAILPATRRPTSGGEGLRPGDLDRVVEASSLAARGVARQAAEESAERSARQAAAAAEAAAQQAVAAFQEANAGRELQRRRTAEVEHERDEATRREFALSLELMLRREMERVLRDELDTLRQEVAGLRNDLTEKVPGQIRLERIETTRLIGSDLEALQAEVRRLAEERVALGGTPAPALTLGSTPANVRPASPPETSTSDPLEPAPPAPGPSSSAAPAPSSAGSPAGSPAGSSAGSTGGSPWSTPTVSHRVPGAGSPAAAASTPTADTARLPEPAPSFPRPVAVPDPAPTPATTPATTPVMTPAVEPEPEPESAPEPAAPTAGAGREVDPFAGLPRLSRWVDPYADDPDSEPDADRDAAPTAPTPTPAQVPAASTTTGGHALPDAGDDTVDPRYVGRRRQPSEAVHAVPDPEPESVPEPAREPEPVSEPVGEARGRRHARDDAEADSRPGGRRRRRDDDANGGGHSRPELVPDDVLARLLGR